MSLKQDYADHLDRVVAWADEALAIAGSTHAGVVVHAGVATAYHADDQDVPFHTVPHFARAVPVSGPEHVLVLAVGEAPRLVRVVPEDFWYEPPGDAPHPYEGLLNQEIVGTRAGVIEALEGAVAGCAYVGNDPAMAEALGLPSDAVEPPPLMAALDWFRAFKTPYEVGCLREAGRIAARGHAAVRAGMAEGLSERALHAAYLHATNHLEHETPYTGIIGWDAHGAILHYSSKACAAPDPGHTLLIDAGASYLGYGSDITRTYVREGVHPVFAGLVDGMETLQRDLVAAVRPGVPYGELHREATRRIGALLADAGLLRADVDDAVESGLVYPFFPHGLGHHLGVQVHDVGGKLAGPDGTVVESPEAFPHLRNTRTLQEGHVVTIEPGLYIIPMLLEPHRQGDRADAFDWALIDALRPCGGIRIEDDVLVTRDGHEDLTRPFVPGHR